MRQDIMVRTMTLRCHEKVMIYNRFAALDARAWAAISA